MELRTRERLTGAAILVALVVLLVPELLSGPRHPARQVPAAGDEPPIRSYTLPLGEGAAGEVAPPGTSSAAPQSIAAESVAPDESAPPTASATAQGAPGTTAARAPGEAGAPAAVGEVGARAAVAAPAAAGTPAAVSAPAVLGKASVKGSVSTPAAVNAGGVVSARGAATATGSASSSVAASRETSRAARPAAAHAASGRGWSVQVGSFASRSNADRLVRELKRKGYGAYVSEISSRGRKWYRVRVGPERDRTTAAAVARRLHTAGRAGEIIPP